MSIIKIFLSIKDAIFILKGFDTDFVNMLNKKIKKKKKRKIEVYGIFNETNQWIKKGYACNTEIYNKIDFTKKDIYRWPKKSSLSCWFCTRVIGDKIPIGIPYKKKDDIYYTFGAFCSFPCAYTWNLKNGSNKWTHNSLLINMCYLMTKKTIIKKAPPKEYLIKYGGTLTFDEYEELINNMDTYTISYIPPLVSLGSLNSIYKIKNE